MSQVITTALKEMKARQKKLQPLAAEFRQVESAIRALEAVDGRSKPAPHRPPRIWGEKDHRPTPRTPAQGRAHARRAVLHARQGASRGDNL